MSRQAFRFLAHGPAERNQLPQLLFGGVKILLAQERFRQVEVRLFQIGRVADRDRPSKVFDSVGIFTQQQM